MNEIVVKLSGRALGDATGDLSAAFAIDVAAMVARGDRVVVVHGAGPQIDDLSQRLGLERHFDDGWRVTDDEMMSVVAMVLARVNVSLVGALGRAGLAAVGVSGADDRLLVSRALGERWGRAGGPPVVRVRLLESLIALGYVPVVSPVAVDDAGELLNCNADTAAGAIAASLAADTVVLLSDVDQLLSDPDDPASALATTSAATLQSLFSSGAAREGMRPKALAALAALEGGARRVVLANGTRAHALKDALAGRGLSTEVRP